MAQQKAIQSNRNEQNDYSADKAGLHSKQM
jgi:hypothetical protein